MKAVHSREFWEKHWDGMIQRIPGEQYMNLEAELAAEMKSVDEGLKVAEANVTDEQYKMLQQIKAKEIIEKATAKCKAQMAVAKRIKSGVAQFGYTNETQEIRAKHEYMMRFEFNCYQLSVFREKYGL